MHIFHKWGEWKDMPISPYFNYTGQQGKGILHTRTCTVCKKTVIRKEI